MRTRSYWRTGITKIVTPIAIFSMVGGAALEASAVKAKRKPSSVERPPQFVLFAFDGSLNNDFWQESIDFADTVKTTGMDGVKGGSQLRFTYFVNPVYYLDSGYKSEYQTPRMGKPVSCIGWADKRENILARVDHTMTAFKQGHEIGSHANSHCDASGQDSDNPMFGKAWGLEDWRSEFQQFNKILFGVFKVNRMTPPDRYSEGLPLAKSNIVGFRAPLLATTPSMWTALREFGFRYDTSKSSEPTYWPQRHPTEGVWNFPLGEIKVAGTSKRTFSMDYNWLCRQSACVTKPGLTEDERQAFKNQMLDSYKYYFKINYFGGRGPVHIGHHFSKWNKGAYWDAMKEFAKFVCTKPEVRCVTYKEYADWLDRLAKNDPSRLASYRQADFERLRDDNTIRNIATPTLAEVRLEADERGFQAAVEPEVRDRMDAQGVHLRISVNFQPINPAADFISRADLINLIGKSETSTALVRAAIVGGKGQEISWQTRRVTGLGTPAEVISAPLEDGAMKAETNAAHMMME